MLLVFTVANTMTYPTELRVFCLRFMMWLRDQSPDVLDKQLLDVDADNRCLVEDLLIKYMVIDGGESAVLASKFLVGVCISPMSQRRLGETARLTELVGLLKATSDQVVALNLLYCFLNLTTSDANQVRREH